MAANHHDVKCILLIDDDYTTRECMSVILAAAGYRVCVARNGADALVRLRSCQRPDLILLDLQMPVMGGCDFCTQRKASAELSAIPIVVISGLPDADTQANLLGAVACLHKPIDPGNLLTRLHEWIVTTPSATVLPGSS
jgi:CheY-like chemotaxis protein